MTEDEEDASTPDFEDVDGRTVAVLNYRCPECQTETRFTEKDEGEDGKLTCSGLGCGATIRLEPRGLRAVQRELDENERALSKGFEDLFPGE